MEKEIIEFVKEELKNDNSGHDFSHIERVVNNAKKIMKIEGGNEKIILTSCYLHDTVDKKLFDDIDNQILKIKQLLKKSFQEEEINEIVDIITSISFNNNNFKEITSLNAMIVRDADRLDAIGSVGIIRTITYGTSKSRKFYEDDNLKMINDKYTFNKSTTTTLSHFYDKLLKLKDLMHTSTGKRLSEERMDIINLFLQHFYDEIS